MMPPASALGLSTVPRGLLALVVSLTLLTQTAWSTPTVHAESNGQVDGQVRNGTAGGATPAGLAVVLHSVDESDRVERLSTVTDTEGRFRFQNLETASEMRFLPIAEYQGALYYPRPFKLSEQPRQEVEIVVFEATPSDQWIAMERANLLVQGVGPNRLEVMEMGAVANVGDRTFVGSETSDGSSRTTLHFPVPQGAAGITPRLGLGSNELQLSPDGFSVSNPIAPGRHQLAFSYSLPFSEERLQLTKQLTYPTASFNLYLPDVGLRVESSLLAPAGTAELGGQQYLLYSAANLPRGSSVPLALSGLPLVAPSPAQQLGPILIALGSVTLASALGLRYRRRRQASSPRRGSRTATSDLAQLDRQRNQLLEQLALLDERYEQGAIAAVEYRGQRAADKRRLLDLSEQRARHARR